MCRSASGPGEKVTSALALVKGIVSSLISSADLRF